MEQPGRCQSNPIRRTDRNFAAVSLDECRSVCQANRVEDNQLRQIRALVEARQTSSVSGFVKHAIRIALFDAAGWRAMLRDALQESRGPLTADQRIWASAGRMIR
jgi:hypothetical protein